MPARTTSGERALIGRIGAYTKLPHHDAREMTRAARAALWDRFERKVDPGGLLEPVERARRTDMARKALFTRLALKSAQARRRRNERRSPLGEWGLRAVGIHIAIAQRFAP
jgi:hypothetical protein